MFIARANNISTTAHRVRLCAAVFAASVAYFSIPATAAAPTSEETCSANMAAVTSVSPSPFHSLLTYHMKRNPESGYVTMATVENAKPRARAQCCFRVWPKKTMVPLGYVLKLTLLQTKSFRPILPAWK